MWHTCSALTTVSVSIAISTVAVESSGGGNLHLQLLALGGVGRHGVTVVGSQAALTLRSHRLSQLIGCVRAGAPAAQTSVLPVGKTRVSIKWSCCYSNRWKRAKLSEVLKVAMTTRLKFQLACFCVCVPVRAVTMHSVTIFTGMTSLHNKFWLSLWSRLVALTRIQISQSVAALIVCQVS